MADTPHQIKCNCTHPSHGSVPCGKDVAGSGTFCEVCKEKHEAKVPRGTPPSGR
jgi:hypothetical protein